MKPSSHTRVTVPTCIPAPLLLAALAAAVLGACSVERKPSPGASAGAQAFEEKIGKRRFREVEWKVLWERGGTDSDTVLLMPSELTADGHHAYVYDMAADRLVAFRAADGSVAWTVGREGSGPEEFRKVEDVAVRPAGDLLLADPNNNRLTTVSKDGKVSGHTPLDAVPYATSTCSLANGQVLVSTLGSLTGPILRLSPEGKVTAESYLPWPDLEETPAIAQQGFFVRTPDDRCVYVLSLGRGYAVHDGTSFRPPVAFVESFDLPTVQLTPGEGGAPPSARINDNTEAAVGAGADGETLAVAFWGKTKDKGELIDVYSLDRGEYLHSYRAPTVFKRMARAGSTFFFETQRNGYPVLFAAELREKAPAR